MTNQNSSPLSKGEQTRADIIQAAHDLIILNGYHGTSMRKIASQAGIALGGIYNHFASKEDIFRQVILTYHPYHEIMPILANTPFETFEGLIRHTTYLIDDTLTSRPDLFNLMFIEIVEFQSQHIPELVEQIFPLISQIMQRFLGAEDTVRPLPFPMLMRTFLGMILGYFMTKNVLGESIPPEFRENALEHFIEIYLHGILKPEINS